MKRGKLFKPFKMICDKCGKEQKKNEKDSNENWGVYKNVKCECGGEFKINIYQKYT